MLKSLTVSNFRAFKEPVTIDFSTTGNYSFNTEAVKDGIVKTAVMYGKNASGKSSLGLAIFDIVGTLTDNYFSPDKYFNYSNLYSNKGFVSFEYVFSFDNSQTPEWIREDHGYTKWFDYDKITKNAVIRTRRPGDYMTIKNGRKKLKDILIEAKIPANERDSLYIFSAL